MATIFGDVQYTQNGTLTNPCFMKDLSTGWGPPVMWMWVYKPYQNPYENYSYIYHKATEIRQLNAILGAPSCSVKCNNGLSNQRCLMMVDIPSGYVKIAIENGHLERVFPLKMVIFSSYVSLPEGVKCNVNPGLINPKRLFNWEGTI